MKTQINSEIRSKLANLHDAFLNASLQFDRMQKSPIENDPNNPNKFMLSDRGRFERAWLAFLYVLFEAWESEQMKDARELVLSLNPETDLTALIEQGRKDGSINKLREVRHYMCHRDKREYWDEGRMAVFNLEYNIKLHNAFGRALRLTIEKL